MLHNGEREDTRNKKHMLGGTHIQFPLERGSHKEQANKVETFLQLILPVILYCDFCFAFLIQKLDAHPCHHYETLSAGEGLFFCLFLKKEGENG